MYLPFVRAGLPQAPRNRGADGLGFAKIGSRALLDIGVAPVELRVGSLDFGDSALALRKAMTEAVSTFVQMPAYFTPFPKSGAQVFQPSREAAAPPREVLRFDFETLAAWGTPRCRAISGEP
jgi:hypothetical protein